MPTVTTTALNVSAINIANQANIGQQQLANVVNYSNNFNSTDPNHSGALLTHCGIPLFTSKFAPAFLIKREGVSGPVKAELTIDTCPSISSLNCNFGHSGSTKIVMGKGCDALGLTGSAPSIALGNCAFADQNMPFAIGVTGSCSGPGTAILNNNNLWINANGDVNIKDNLNVFNNLGVSGTSTLGPITGASLGITGCAVIYGDLGVTGTSTLGDITGASLGVTGTATVGSIVSGAITGASLGITGGAVIYGDLGVTGTATVGSLVSGAITGASLGITGGAVIYGDLGVTGTATVGSLVSGAITGASLGITGGAVIYGDLGVTGTATVGSLVSGAITGASLGITGGATVGSLVSGAITGASLGITGGAVIYGDLGVTGGATVGSLNQIGCGPSCFEGPVTFKDMVTFNGIAGLTAGGPLSISAIKTDCIQACVGTFNTLSTDSIIVKSMNNGGCGSSGTNLVSWDTTSGTLQYIQNYLGSGGTASLWEYCPPCPGAPGNTMLGGVVYDGNVAVGATCGTVQQIWDANGSTAGIDVFYVNGNTIMHGDLGVTGSAVIYGDLGVTGTATVGTLVSGAITGASLGITGSAVIYGDLGVTGGATVGSLVSGAITGASLGITGGAVIYGDLGVTGTATVNGNFTVGAGSPTLNTGVLFATSAAAAGDAQGQSFTTATTVGGFLYSIKTNAIGGVSGSQLTNGIAASYIRIRQYVNNTETGSTVATTGALSGTILETSMSNPTIINYQYGAYYPTVEFLFSGDTFLSPNTLYVMEFVSGSGVGAYDDGSNQYSGGQSYNINGNNIPSTLRDFPFQVIVTSPILHVDAATNKVYINGVQIP